MKELNQALDKIKALMPVGNEHSAVEGFVIARWDAKCRREHITRLQRLQSPTCTEATAQETEIKSYERRASIALDALTSLEIPADVRAMLMDPDLFSDGFYRGSGGLVDIGSSLKAKDTLLKA